MTVHLNLLICTSGSVDAEPVLAIECMLNLELLATTLTLAAFAIPHIICPASVIEATV